MLKVSRPALAVAILCVAAALPFATHAGQFVERGVPDALFSGDAAVRELGVLHAARSVQTVGPYSQSGLSHPGPAYFYLALPVYEIFGERGPALNLFACLVNLAASVAIVLTARRLRGNLYALAVAALLSVYSLLGIPGLITNESNAVLPVLPLALLGFVAVRLALGDAGWWPVFAFVGSAVAQTHLACAGAVAALLGTVLIARPRTRSERPMLVPTIGVLALCWALPLYDAVFGTGNLVRLIGVPATDYPSWSAAVRLAAEQSAVLPLALLHSLRLGLQTTPAVAYALAGSQMAVLIGLLVDGVRRADRTVTVLTAAALVQGAAAVLVVRAYPADLAAHSVAWISVPGLLAWAAMAARVMPPFERALHPRNARALTTFATVGLIALAVTRTGTPRVYGERDVTVEALATAVEEHLRSAGTEMAVARIESPDVWQAAAAVILHLHKRGIPIAVEDEWLPAFGRQFATPSAGHPALLFGDAALRERAQGRTELGFVGDLGWVYVYLEQETD